MATRRVRRWLNLERFWNHLMAGFQLQLAGLHDFAKICMDSERPSRRRRPVRFELEPLERRWLFAVTALGDIGLSVNPPIENKPTVLTDSFSHDPSYSASQYTAVVQWGDGTSSNGTVTGSGSSANVTA